MSGSGFSSGEASSRQQDWAQAPEGLGMVTDLDHMLSAPLPPLPALASAHTLWLGPRAAPASLGWRSQQVAAQRRSFSVWPDVRLPGAKGHGMGVGEPDLPLPDCSHSPWLSTPPPPHSVGPMCDGQRVGKHLLINSWSCAAN